MNRTVVTRRTAIGSVLVVAGVAAIVSYSHMQHLAESSGEEWRSYLVPLSVDGMLVASTLAIVHRRRSGLPAGWVPWLGLALGILASLAANVAAARPDAIARIIAAWPPIAFAVAVETLVIVLRSTARPADVAGAGAPSTPAVSAAPTEVSAGNAHPPPPDVTEPAEEVNPGRVVGGNVRGVRDTARPGKAKPDAQRARESRDRKKRHSEGDHSTCLPKNCPHVAKPANGAAVRDALLV